uniref:enoyl-CoA hydratase n=1 Tax=Acanthochromis polyacanthus TaxID=80966 RepID=A0A3Q1HSE9_9TELE
MFLCSSLTDWSITSYLSLFLGLISRNLSVSSSWAGKDRFRCYELKDDVAVIRLNDPTAKVCALHMCQRERLCEHTEVMGEIWSNGGVKSAVFISKNPGCFIAGADIKMIQACKSSEEVTCLSREGQKMLEKIEKSPIPVVAAIHGSCLGGGLELAIACQYRISTKSNKTVLGTPEVMLGLLPGAGGTQRLPKMVCLTGAFDMMLTGKNIRAEKAKKMGLVHQLVDPLGMGEPGLKLFRSNCLRIRRYLIFSSLLQKKKKIYKTISERVQKQTKNLYPAPHKIIEVTLAGAGQAHYLAEAEVRLELGSWYNFGCRTVVFRKIQFSKAPPYLSFTEIGQKPSGQAFSLTVTEFTGIHVPVPRYFYIPVCIYTFFCPQVVPSHCIFVSNTSGLPIKDIAAASQCPENVIGMRYFSPVEKMQLLEIITTDKASTDTLASGVNVGLKQGKVIIIVKDGPWFYITRCLLWVFLEYIRIFQEGVEVQRLDALLESFGFHTGLSVVADEVGLGIALHISEVKLCGFSIYGKTREERKTNPGMEEIFRNYKMTTTLAMYDKSLWSDVPSLHCDCFLNIHNACPFRFIDTFDAERLVSTMRCYEDVYGNQFTPCQLILDHSKDHSKKFYK